jgi:hypothetical protein
MHILGHSIHPAEQPRAHDHTPPAEAFACLCLRTTLWVLAARFDVHDAGIRLYRRDV